MAGRRKSKPLSESITDALISVSPRYRRPPATVLAAVGLGAIGLRILHDAERRIRWMNAARDALTGKDRTAR